MQNNMNFCIKIPETSKNKKCDSSGNENKNLIFIFIMLYFQITNILYVT
jgi:hypothetical protein